MIAGQLDAVISVYFADSWDIILVIICFMSFCGTNLETVKVWRCKTDERISYPFNLLAFLTLFLTSLEALQKGNYALSSLTMINSIATMIFLIVCRFMRDRKKGMQHEYEIQLLGLTLFALASFAYAAVTFSHTPLETMYQLLILFPVMIALTGVAGLFQSKKLYQEGIQKRQGVGSVSEGRIVLMTVATYLCARYGYEKGVTYQMLLNAVACVVWLLNLFLFTMAKQRQV